MNSVVAVVALIALSNPVRSEEKAESDEYLYGEMEFLEVVPTQPHFVKFFAPWCSHCQDMKEEWNKLAELYNEKEPGRAVVAEVDCTQSKELCLSSGVKELPTIQLLLPGEDMIPYDGERKFDDLNEFLLKHLPETEVPPDIVEEEDPVTEGLYDLSSHSFYQHCSKGYVFALFIQDGCEICEKVKETWKEIAKFYEDNEDVKIALVDCVKAKLVCEWETISGYPIMRYYHDGVPIQTRSITPGIKGLKNYIDRKLSEKPAEIDEGKLVKMTDKTIKSIISAGVTFAKLYHPQCGFCRRMVRAWNELANVDFSDAPAPVTIAELDCAEYPDACKENGGRGYPTLVAYMNGDIVASYQGPRSLEDMKQFVYDLARGYQPKREPPPELVPVEGLYNMTGWDFFRATMKGKCFVLFVHEGCEYCEKVMEAWKAVARFFQDDEDTKIGQADCKDNKDVCQSQAIRGYPIVKYYVNGNEIESRSITPNPRDMISYISDKLKEPEVATGYTGGSVIKLTNTTIKDVISKGVTFVKFFSPGCGFCKRMERAWEMLGERDFSSAAGPVTIAELDCSQYAEACRENGGRGFPSLIVFIDGELAARYGSYSPRTPENMQKFVLEMANGYQHKDHQRDEL